MPPARRRRWGGRGVEEERLLVLEDEGSWKSLRARTESSYWCRQVERKKKDDMVVS